MPENNRYMVQLLSLVVHAVCAPALQNSGFAVCLLWINQLGILLIYLIVTFLSFFGYFVAFSFPD